MDLRKTNASGYFVNQNGVVIRDDEDAWAKYQSEREAARILANLVQSVEEIKTKMTELERKLNEAITSN